jgi:hypothetical protein
MQQVLQSWNRHLQVLPVFLSWQLPAEYVPVMCTIMIVVALIYEKFLEPGLPNGNIHEAV